MWSADRARFSEGKTTRPRLRGALYTYCTSNTSTQQLGHSSVVAKVRFQISFAFSKLFMLYCLYLGHDERTNLLKLKALSRLVFGDCPHNHHKPCEIASGVRRWQTRIDWSWWYSGSAKRARWRGLPRKLQSLRVAPKPGARGRMPGACACMRARVYVLGSRKVYGAPHACAACYKPEKVGIY